MANGRRARNYQIDMTTGSILPKMAAYSVPLVLSGILQLLYNAADVIVVGQFASSQAQAAVTSTGSLINLLVNLFMGLSVGANVIIARYYGAGDLPALQRAENTTVSLGGILGVAVGIFGFLAAKPMLEWMGSPDDVIEGATLYVRIYFLGMPANMLYNFGAAVLRAVGDTRRPLYYLAFSGLVNVLMNLLLVIGFRMDVAGVAIATILSQYISAVLVLSCLIRSRNEIHLEWRKLHIYKRELKAIARIGLPAGLQGCVFSISNVLIQSSVNSFGSLVIAGNGIASNLEGFVYTGMNALYQACLTSSSQNYGAGKYNRVRRGLWVCLLLVFIVGEVIGGLFLLFGQTLLGIYNADPTVVEYGMIRLRLLTLTYSLCGMMDVMVGQLRGIGYSVMPMIVSLTGCCLFRIIWIYTVFAANHLTWVLYLSYPISWAITFLTHLICYWVVSRKRLPKITQEAL